MPASINSSQGSLQLYLRNVHQSILREHTNMRRVHGLALTSILTLPHVHNVMALQIDPPLPSNVMRHDPVPFTWFRNASDPPLFGFQKVQLQGFDGGRGSQIHPVQGVENKQNGSFTLTFTEASPFLVVGVDLRDQKKTFFVAPGTLVALESVTTTLSSSSSPSETHPGITTTNSSVLPISAPITTPISSINTSRGTISIPQATSTNSSSTPIPQDNRKSNNGTIIGAIVGGVAGLIIIIASVFFLLWRRKRKHQNNYDHDSMQSLSSRTTSRYYTRDCKAQMI